MEPSNAPMEKRGSSIKAIFEGMLYFASAFVLAMGIQAYIARPFIVNGASMDPTIQDGEYLIIDEISYRFNPPARGDVVVFKAPPSPDKYYIKRIIGLPGETVQIKKGVVTIINKESPNGFTLNNPLITHPLEENVEFKVPLHGYFVMGDNRNGSYDSRSWGVLPKENLRGRAFVRLLPLSRIELMPGDINYSN